MDERPTKEMRNKMRQIDAYLEKLDEELLIYTRNKADWIAERKFNEHMAEMIKNNKKEKRNKK